MPPPSSRCEGHARSLTCPLKPSPLSPQLSPPLPFLPRFLLGQNVRLADQTDLTSRAIFSSPTRPTSPGRYGRHHHRLDSVIALTSRDSCDMRILIHSRPDALTQRNGTPPIERVAIAAARSRYPRLRG